MTCSAGWFGSVRALMLRTGRTVASIAVMSALAWTFAPTAVAAPRAAPPEACALVTEAELEPITGYAVEPGKAIVGSAKATGCGYTSTDPAAGPDVGILLTTTANGTAKKLFGVKKLERQFGRSKKIVGVGKRANFSFVRGKAPQAALLAIDGSRGVEVVLGGKTTRTKAQAETQAIATLVLTKLA